MFKIHFKPFWVILDILFFGWKWGGTPILSHFPALFLRFCQFWKFLQVFWTFKGWKFFFPKVPQLWSTFRKKCKKVSHNFCPKKGGRVKQNLTFVNFCIFLRPEHDPEHHFSSIIQHVILCTILTVILTSILRIILSLTIRFSDLGASRKTWTKQN